jgi:nucleoside-diphosphate-sugar epimerase
MEKVLVTGAGGFIGSQLVSSLKRRGYWVRGADQKVPEFTDADEFELLDCVERNLPDHDIRLQ